MSPEESRAAENETLGGKLASQSSQVWETVKWAQGLCLAAELYRAAGAGRSKPGAYIEEEANGRSSEAADKRRVSGEERAAAAAAPDKAERNKHNHRADDIDLEAENISKVAWELADQSAYQYHLAAQNLEVESKLHHDASKLEPDRQKAGRQEDESVKILLEAANNRRKSAELYRHAANEPGNPDSRTKHSQAAEQFEMAAKDRQRSIDNPNSIGGLGEKQKQQTLQKQDESNAGDESRRSR